MIDMTLENPKVTIGLDLGDRLSRTYEVDATGARQAEATVATTPQGLQRYFGGRAPSRVVLEASTHSPSLLAQQHLEFLRARDQLVRTRAQLITHVRSAVKVTGTRLRPSSAPAFVATAGPSIPVERGAATAPVLTIIQALTQQIREADRRIAGVIREHYPVASRLQQISGVGPITALAFVLLVDDPTRLADSRDVGAYFGLVPRLDESSDSQPQLRITKSGDGLGRRLLVTAAHYILGPFGPECDLRRHGLAIAARGAKNGKKRAVVAVARKLAVLLHHLWVSEQSYDPDYVLKQRARTR